MRPMKIGWLLGLLVLLALACGPAATPTPTPKPTPTPTPTAAPTPTPTPTATPKLVATPTPTPTAAPIAAPTPTPVTAIPKEVPRNRTLKLILGGREGKFVDHEIWNPYAIGASHGGGQGPLFHEPLYYYSAFADKEIPWLAESYKYSADLKELTYTLRPGIVWSDGKPFSAEDVAFTYNSLRDFGPKVKWGVDVGLFLEEAKAVDARTVTFKFKIPAPKFHHFISYKFDIGVYIVPKHVFEGQDWTKFTFNDPAKGWPVTTAPWRLTLVSPEQKIIGRVAKCEEWWGCKTGFRKLPEVERILYLPLVGATQTAAALIANEVDSAGPGGLIDPFTHKKIQEQNPKVITHSGRKPPYGYTDWWPASILFNDTRYPYNDADVRWAISYYIDREQVVEVAWGGAGKPSRLPWPDYPGLKPYTDAIADLLEKYPTNKYDPKRGDELLTKDGWKKDKEGFWVDAKGDRIKCTILGYASFAAEGPVFAEQLKRHGIDASYAQPPDYGDRVTRGDFECAVRGHGGSVAGDPYWTLRLYQSATEAVPGAHLVNFYWWKNAEYDKIVDEMAMVPFADQKKLIELTRKAMEIWLRELPDVQTLEFYHRIVMNTTYWTNWPTAENPYLNGAMWHLTFGLLLHELKAAQ